MSKNASSVMGFRSLFNCSTVEFFENDLDIKDLETTVKKLETFKVPETTSGTIQKLHHMQKPLVLWPYLELQQWLSWSLYWQYASKHIGIEGHC